MILLGDCRDVMATLDAVSIDSIVTDPPYGLSFMGKGWDHGVPGADFWIEAMRVTKPGAHLLAFGGTRTYHRLACAIEDAGWEIRDCVMWVYGSGLPKSHDVSKAIDKAAGAEREITAPVTEDAKRWNGWGTALKPAYEPIIVARKPLVGTVAENVLTHGTGGINVDGCRVGRDTGDVSGWSLSGSKASENRAMSGGNYARDAKPDADGRWPANLIHDGSDEVTAGFPNAGGGFGKRGALNGGATSCGFKGGMQEVGYGDSGSAARFFYCAKASKSDRDEGCDELPSKQMGLYAQDEWSRQHMGSTPDARREARHNTHPTVKPTALMRYLCRLVTPPGGLVLDPFAGSGSTGKAAILEGFRFVGIEQDETYAAIARARIDDAMKSRGEA